MDEPLPEMAYITRRHYEKTPLSWWVRFALTHRGKTTMISSKTFNDSKYIDGKEEALFFAQEWRDCEYQNLREQEIIIPYQAINGNGIPPVYTIIRPNNTSGVIGVEKVDSYYMKNINGRLCPVHAYSWKATWVEYDIRNGEPRRRCRNQTFSITRWGNGPAFKKACRARKLKETYIMSDRHLKMRNRYRKAMKGINDG
jgi:hypothetical protein